MINFAMVVRTRDGLALSESTDSQQSPTHRSSRRYIKLLQKIIKTLQDRCIVKLDSQKILMIKSVGISYIALCDNSYPNVLGYSFLNEIQKEFISTYENRHIVSAIRPYSFIDFDYTIKNLKTKYNNPRSLTTKLNLSDMSEEIKLRPPVNIPVSILESRNQYGVDCNYVDPIKQERTDPITCTAWISIAVTTICAFFNFSRGLTFINNANWEGLDYKSPITGFIFLFETVLEVLQICLLVHHMRLKWIFSFVVFLSFCACNLYQQDVKSNTQIYTQVACSAFITICIYLRKVHSKSPHYNV